ncbi:hypothetical protein [Rickettsia endosymbiont of Gonocerus acuteangulatus]|uniref:hypothetical protein n=1 Tax=Rickettsia endosymbiont of Gonocerus acuteangulatus TaxID=3066266 RepID=UPI003132A144
MQNQNTDYSPVIEELKKAYKNYIITKDALIEVGTFGITVGTLGLISFFGTVMVGSLMLGSVLAIGKAKEAYKKELFNALSMKMQGLSRTKPINFLPKFHWGFYNQKSFLACYLKSQQHCQDLFV